ncbi:MAG: cupin domain-containing protein, partial [Blastomonas fulva]
MPVFNDASSVDWEDPDLVPRPVITIGATGVDMSAAAAEDDSHLVDSRKEANFHHHRKGQFLLWMRGVLTCEVAGGLWLVPPGSAIWVPGGVEHRMEVAGTVEC